MFSTDVILLSKDFHREGNREKKNEWKEKQIQQEQDSINNFQQSFNDSSSFDP